MLIVSYISEKNVMMFLKLQVHLFNPFDLGSIQSSCEHKIQLLKPDKNRIQHLFNFKIN